MKTKKKIAALRAARRQDYATWSEYLDAYRDDHDRVAQATLEGDAYVARWQVRAISLDCCPGRGGVTAGYRIDDFDSEDAVCLTCRRVYQLDVLFIERWPRRTTLDRVGCTTRPNRSVTRRIT